LSSNVPEYVFELKNKSEVFFQYGWHGRVREKLGHIRTSLTHGGFMQS